ncbi:hypothetical protein ADK52_11820, partial [Streptomyces sp. WM6372]|uniref:family 10 glycosylhydrolase n=1 Tax=Streptomyces sp. WM6372 TaxID=1415555 RepID=UPI0006C03491
LNAVVLQVRPAADAMWPGAREPWSQGLTGAQGEDPGWDPLGRAGAEAHAPGREPPAWFNPSRGAHHPHPARLGAVGAVVVEHLPLHGVRLEVVEPVHPVHLVPGEGVEDV